MTYNNVVVVSHFKGNIFSPRGIGIGEGEGEGVKNRIGIGP